MKLLVLDGNSILNRAFYGIKLLSTQSGQYTNAIYGFMNILLKLEESEAPDEIAIAFDLRAPTFRHEMYDGYKAKRKPMPQELAQQMPVLKQLLGLLGYAEVSCEGYEADDILGTLAAVSAESENTAVLATGDRDSLQLVGENVSVLLTTTKGGKGETSRITPDVVREKYGVSPRQLIDVKALMGDASDNIPGVPGVGEKTAFALIQEFGSLQGVYDNLQSSSIKPAARTKLENGKKLAELSLKLAEINCKAPVATEIGSYKKRPVQQAEAAALLSQLEMFSLVSRFGLSAAGAAEATPTAKNLPKASVQPLLEQLSGMVFMAEQEGAWLVVPAGSSTVYVAESQSPELCALLQNPKAYKRVFDSKELHRIALAQNGGKTPAENIVFDAKLAAYLLNPAASAYEVQQLAAQYGIAAQFSCEQYPSAPFLEPLFRHLATECEAAGMQPLLHDIEQPLAEVLASMELCGVAFDAEGLKEFGQQLQSELEKQLADIYEAAGCEFNLNSPKQLREVLFGTLGLPTRKKTKSGYSTDAETLESLRKYHPVIDSILMYRTYQKLNSTYVEGLLKQVGEDGRIHTTFHQTEARTGRISSAEPNLQNIPVRTELGSRLRRFFVAPGGMELADADYSQIELRILAHISDDDAMREAFQNGEDIHTATAARVNGLPTNMVTPQLRSAAKAVNFGIVYGIGAFSLSKDIGVSVKEADEFIKTYLSHYPGVQNYMHSTVEYGKQHGYVQTLYGRRRSLPELASSNRNVAALGERMAMNTPIQGTAADVIKLAMIRVWRRLRAEGLLARLVLQVHDELIVEAPKSELAAVGDILKQEMEGAAQLSVKLQADVHTGENWLAAKG